MVESAFFNPDIIIGKSTKYNLVSDAAYKFERYVDINLQEFALRRFINIIKDHAKIKSIAIKREGTSEFTNKKINRDYSRINNILGTSLDKEYIDNILNSLGFSLREDFIVPSWRFDIESINDLAEEVARVIGYDNIPISNLTIPEKTKNKDSNSKVNKIRNYLVKKGFNEVINNPFVATNETGAIKVDNPLDSNKNFLRLNLVNSLIKNLDFNEKRQKEVIKLFEISDIYLKDENKKIISKKVLSMIISGRQGLNYKYFNRKLDESYLKEISSYFGLDETYIKEIDRSLLDSKIKNKIYNIECMISDIDVTHIDHNSSELSTYSFAKFLPISELPSSKRDISISLDNEELLEQLIETIFSLNL